MKGSSYILGGLLEGVGSSLVLAGAAKREAAHRMLELEMRNAEAARDRDFRAGESKLDRDARAAEAGAQRDFTSGENALTRKQQSELQDDQQTFTAGENEANRDATAANAAADRAARAESDRRSDERADKDRVARLDEGQKDRAFKSAEARLDREARGNESAADRQARFDQILIEEENRERDRQLTRDENQKNRDGDLTETYDPESPTGSTLTPKGEAAGKPGVPTADQMEAQNADKQRTEADARSRAEEIVDGMESWWSTDTTDFGQGGRAAAVEQVADAIKQGKDKVVVNGRTVVLKGTEGDGGNASPSSESPAKPDAQQPNAKLQGTGTEKDPFKPVSKVDMASIPSGGIFLNPADNKLYRKK